MLTSYKLATLALGSAAVLPLFGAGAAFAADGNVSANLKPVALNGVNGSGMASVSVTGTTITVKMAASGLLAGSPHAAHIHFGADARHECPVASDDAKQDGHLNTTDGGPAYGPIVVSLTKTGDTSPKSALAVERFDTAQGGKISYERGSIKVTQTVADAISAGKAVVVIHGVDYNKDGKYSGSVKSELAPTLPTEATDPALCGVLSAMPSGGVATGAGGASSGTSGEPMIALGAGLMLVAAGSGVYSVRRARARS
ncbi:MAG: CHRD domain-containing protein [Dermatophilaceae bacterium]